MQYWDMTKDEIESMFALCMMTLLEAEQGSEAAGQSPTCSRLLRLLDFCSQQPSPTADNRPETGQAACESYSTPQYCEHKSSTSSEA